MASSPSSGFLLPKTPRRSRTKQVQPSASTSYFPSIFLTSSEALPPKPYKAQLESQSPTTRFGWLSELRRRYGISTKTSFAPGHLTSTTPLPATTRSLSQRSCISPTMILLLSPRSSAGCKLEPSPAASAQTLNQSRRRFERKPRSCMSSRGASCGFWLTRLVTPSFPNLPSLDHVET